MTSKRAPPLKWYAVDVDDPVFVGLEQVHKLCRGPDRPVAAYIRFFAEKFEVVLMVHLDTSLNNQVWRGKRLGRYTTEGEAKLAARKEAVKWRFFDNIQ